VLRARPARRNYDRSSANSNFFIRFDARVVSTVCTYLTLAQFSTGDIPSLFFYKKSPSLADGFGKTSECYLFASTSTVVFGLSNNQRQSEKNDVRNLEKLEPSSFSGK
jgi:hypothetical protein